MTFRGGVAALRRCDVASAYNCLCYMMVLRIFVFHTFGGHLLLLFVKIVVYFALLLQMYCFSFGIACCS